jgi:hypothetical protein
MSQSARVKKGEVKGRQAHRCSLCGHMRRFHKEHVGLPVGVCSKCTINPPYMHNFDEPPRSQGEIEEKKFEQLLNAPRYPEHEKLNALAGANQTLGEFIEWFEQDGRSLAAPHEHTEECDPPRDETRFSGRACGRYSGDNGILYVWEPSGLGSRVDRILAAFFGIDRDKLEAEKLAMLEDLQAAARP